MDKTITQAYIYGNVYQNQQVKKYMNRHNNHWQFRIAIFDKLLNNKVMPLFKDKEAKELLVADIGCSIGTFALEAARRGFNAAGIDFDKEAIEIARKLAQDENVNAAFYCGDICKESDFPEKIDIAICFDIFEHLHDDQLGALLLALHGKLSKNGVILFHTFPTQYDYIFFESNFAYIPLIPFIFTGKKLFARVLSIYTKMIDSVLIIFKGSDYKEFIKNKAHCNPTSQDRLSEILIRAGFTIHFIESAQLYPFKKRIQKIFKNQPVTFRNLYGVASL
jgi:2-polyprenyl-3-methyl-5-hydroxy-6-metoxy-1,4-benzoquinol methylase